MNAPPADDDRHGPAGDEPLLDAVRRHRRSLRRSLEEGEPTLARQLATVGVLGWIVVVPLLAGVALGRWIDRWLGTGITVTAALMLLGLGIGCWSAWRWMHES